MNCSHKLVVCYAIFYAGCSTPGTYYPPVELDSSIMGFGLSIHLGGYTVPAKVVIGTEINTPTVLVPASAPVTSGVVPVTNAIGQTAQLPVQVAAVTQPTVVIPKP